MVSDSSVAIVIDGGCLVQRVGWGKNSTFDAISESYVSFLKKIFGEPLNRVHVVFDGYLTASTKDHTHQKRYPVKSMDMMVEGPRKLLCTKTIFLSNNNNK